MKHFINILVILILTAFAVGIAWVTLNSSSVSNIWGLLFIPLIVMMVLWGYKIKDDY